MDEFHSVLESHRIDRQQFRALKFANLYLKWIPRLADNANDPRNAAVGCIEGLLASIVEVSDGLCAFALVILY